MKRVVLVLALGACGRLGFDPVGDGAGDDAGIDPLREAVGDPDPTFGTGGATILVRGVEDGKIYDVRPRANGYFSYGQVVLESGNSTGQLIAWTRDGQLDARFPTDGIATVSVGTADWGYGLLQLADRRWLLMGDGFVPARGDDDLLFSMITEDGQPSSSFGILGYEYLHVDGFDSAYRAVETARGVVACGITLRAGADPHHALIGMMLTGRLDLGFGTSGVLIDDGPGTDDSCFDIAVDGAGRLLTIGTSDNRKIVTRYSPLGVRDPSFATGGRFTAPGTTGPGRAVALAPDGDIVIAGGENQGGLVMRFSPDGVVRSTFGQGGIVELQLGLAGPASEVLFLDVVVQANGKIVATGYRRVSSTDVDGVIVRLLPDGALDPAFGTNGVVQIDVGEVDELHAIHAEPGGLIAVGSATVGGVGRPWILRLR